MKKIFSLFLIFISFNLFSQEEVFDRGFNSITQQKIQAQLQFLASDWTKGREPGTRGIESAAEYIRSMFMYAGLEPGDALNPDQNLWYQQDKDVDYFQTFDLIKSPKTFEGSLTVTDKTTSLTFQAKTDLNLISGYASSFSLNNSFVFVGYGLKNARLNYDAYKGLDVKGKIVVVLRGFPGYMDEDSELAKYFTNAGKNINVSELEQDKVDVAKTNGAVAVIFINPTIDFPGIVESNIYKYSSRKWYEGDKPWGVTAHRYRIPESTEDKLVILEVSKRAGSALLAGSDYSPDKFYNFRINNLEAGLKNKNPKTLNLIVNKEEELIKVKNVLAVIKGEDTTKSVVVGAHYDHLGTYDGRIYNGADDNGSGTIAVMMLAEAFKESGIKPKYNMIFAAWTAEEKGLLGSKYFADHPTTDSVLYYMNFDMIGRLDERDTIRHKARMVYTGSVPALQSTIEEGLKTYDIGLKINFSPRSLPRGGSDHTSFSMKGIPVSYFLAGWHNDYHQPWDETSAIAYDNMELIIKSAYIQLWEIANGNVFK
ncbi:M20/M25/M40 family metallo-hydrolase [Saccharicrinis sp. FJH62]|uniref:M20/M25/M40 family metallo-hydrolase n=1 Tax=Saccharicrinis sp. FJH62 TaxID=3344657 RepID=UPI0035D4C952